MTCWAWLSRVVRAVFIVVALLAVIAFSGWAESVASAQGPSVSQGVGIRSSSFVGESNLDVLLAHLEKAAEADRNDLPRYFEVELGLIEGARDVRVNDGGNTVGYVVDCAPSDAIEAISNLMSQRGWLEVPLGNEEGITFVKDDGACTWALVTCTDVAGATSVVYRCMVA